MASRDRSRKRWQKAVSIAACLVVLVTSYALIHPAITMSGETTWCGMEEHVHDENCYSMVYLGDSLDDTEASYEQVLTCALPEHVHTDECFMRLDEPEELYEPDESDEWYESEESDESYELYELNGLYEPDDEMYLAECPDLTGDWAEDLLELAKSQIGYTESWNGYTMYSSDFYETDDSWNTAFAVWCLDRVGIPEEPDFDAGMTAYVPRESDATRWFSALCEENLLQDGTQARPGDLMFFLDDDGEARVAIVSRRMKNIFRNENGWKLILGDANGRVEELTYDMDALEIVGSVSIPENPASYESYEYDTSVGEDDDTFPDDEEHTVRTSRASSGRVWATVEVEQAPRMLMRSFRMPLMALGAAPAPTPSAPLVLGGNVTGSGSTGAAKIKWRLPDESEWQAYSDNDEISANAELQITISYGDLDPSVLAAHGYRIVYYTDDIMEELAASGDIRMEGEKRGTITAASVEDEEGKLRTAIMLDFSSSSDWVDSLDTNSTLSGSFTYQGRMDLGKIEQSGESGITLAGIQITVPDVEDATSRFADVDLEKSHGGMIPGDDGKYYMEYTLKVTAGRYGCPDVKLIDTFTKDASAAGIKYVSGYVGVTETPVDADNTDVAVGPVETITGNALAQPGEVYLTNDTEGTRGAMPAPADNGRSLAWAIGDMEAGESRTLTYRVAVTDDYIGLAHNNDPIINGASLYSKEFERGYEEEPYQANAAATVSKQSANGRLGADGRYYIDYTAVITANPDNDYPLTDVKYHDVPNQYTGNAYQSQITVDTDSFRLYKLEKGERIPLDLQDYTNYTSADGVPTTRSNPRMSGNNFDLFVGDLKPGEQREIQYTMSIDVDKATAMGNGDIGIYNYGYVHSDEIRQNQQMDSSSTSDTLNSITWMNKQKGAQTTTAQTVTFPRNAEVYDATGTTAGLDRLPVITGENAYTIPAGAYEYQVVINQSGEWDVTATQWRDELQLSGDGHRYMQFVDYVRVDVFDTVTNQNGKTIGFNDNGTTEPQKSVWVKIDGNWSFAFTGKQIGMEGDDAYILHYYTVAILPEGVASYGTASVDNSFSLSGNVVGPGGKQYYLNGISQRVNVTAKEPGVNDPLKAAWYYDAGDKTFDSYHEGKSNGALYWVIKMSGDKIPKNMQFQESTRVGSGWPTHYLRNDESLIGFYIVQFDEGADDKDSADEFLARYSNIRDFYADLDSGRIREVPDTLYSQRWNGYTSTTYGDNGQHYDFTVMFNQDYSIGAGEALYLLIKTDPVTMPGNGASIAYTNKCNYKTDAMGSVTNWPNVQATQKIVGPEGGIDKIASGAYTVKNNNFTKIDPSAPNVMKDVALDRTDFETSAAANMTNNYPDGTYVMWTLAVDKGQQMHGAYDIVDTLPEGVELVYIRPSVAYTSFNRPAGYCYYIGPDIMNRSEIEVATRDISAKYKTTTWAWTITGDDPALEADGWTKHVCASKCDNATLSRNATAAIYYTKGNQIRMHLPNMIDNKFDFQVLCRLTDEAEQDRLFGDVTLNNQVTLYQSGEKVESDGAEITVSGGGVSKNLLMDGAYNQSDPTKLATTRFPYTIAVNEERKDMIPQSGVLTIPLIDRMTGNMALDLSTLEIYALPAGVEEVTDYTHLVYYGGMYSDKEADEGKPWYDPTKVGQPVGNLKSGSIVVATRSAVDKDNNDTPILDANGSQMKEIVFENLPDSTKIVIKYSVSVTMENGKLKFDNNAFWEGYENNSGGDTEEVEMDYLAESEVSETKHGAVHVIKYDNDNITTRLAGAEFGLYRAEYVVAKEKVYVDGVKVDPVEKHILAVYQGTDTSPASKDPEIDVRYNADGSIAELHVITGAGKTEWMEISEAQTRGYSFHHQLDLVDGELQICPRETLAIGSTDANGNLSYGFGSELDYGDHYYYNEQGEKVPIKSTIEGEGRIHFNKIYAVKELKAPEGYVLDPKPHFFVVPNDQTTYDGQGLNYFARGAWPAGVHVCTKSENGEITFMDNVGNSRPRLSLTKEFAGNIGAYHPGTYSVGIWEESVTRPTPENMIASVSVHYTEYDFGYYTPEGGSEEIYGLLPGHEKTVEFPITLGFGNYWVYELNDEGYPIVPVAGTATGTVNALSYTVSLSGESAEDTPGKIVYSGTRHDVTVTNTTYAMEVTKRFANISGDYLDQGLVGTYRFGIWPEDEVDPETGLPTTPVGLRNVLEASWTLSDVESEKTVMFSGLKAGTTYYVFELDEDHVPIANDAAVVSGGNKYMVRYEYGNTGTPDDRTEPHVYITNAATVILPSAGGWGTNFITYSGAALMALACFGYAAYLLRRRRRKEETS